MNQAGLKFDYLNFPAAGASVQWTNNSTGEPVRIWQDVIDKPEYDIIVDETMLSKLTIVELRDRIDRVNIKYNFKLSKGTKKTQLVQTLLGSYMIIATKSKIQESVASTDVVSPETNAIEHNESSVKVEPLPSAKRVKNATQTLRNRVYRYNFMIEEGTLEGCSCNYRVP